MLRVLRAADGRPAGVTVRQLVNNAQRAGCSQRTARAAVSMCIRRAWRRGLLELHGRHVADTMTAQQQRARQIATTARANPEAFYAAASAFCGDKWGSADACLAAKEQQATTMPRLRVARVSVTEHGRAVLERLTTAPAVQSTDPAEAGRAIVEATARVG